MNDRPASARRKCVADSPRLDAKCGLLDVCAVVSYPWLDRFLVIPVTVARRLGHNSLPQKAVLHYNMKLKLNFIFKIN